ncbi:MAG: hypothetical protein EOM68_23170, partial [Spirochaetia bacterium]|nr:hypothetical protein [Spirochaetia bacterium]
MTLLALNSLAAAVRHGVDVEQEQAKMYQQMLSLAAVAEEEDEEGQVDASAIGSAASLVSALQPVSIDKDLYKEYNAFFFHSKRTGFVSLLKSVGEVSVSLNYFFALMRNLLKDGRRIARLEADPEALRTYIQSEAVRYHEYASQNDARNSPLADSVKNMLMSIMAGSKFYLRSSQVYSNGYDIVVREGIRDSHVVGSSIGAESFLNSFTHDYGYETERLEAYSCETCLRIQQAAEKIISEMFGGAATATASAPVETTKPLNYDFPGLQRIFESTLGITLPVEFFHRVDYKSVRGSDAQNFVRLVFVLAPDRRLSDAIKSELGRAAATTDADPIDLLPNILHRQTEAETKESRVLNRSFGGTLAFTLSEDLSKYISQSETPNPHNIKSWYVIWASQFLRRTGKSSQAKAAVRVGKIRLNQIPRFSLPISQLEAVTKIRSTVGMTVESTRANEDEIYFSTDGTLSSLPPVEERSSFAHLTEFETISRELSELAVKYNAPLSAFRSSRADAALLGISGTDYERGKELNQKLDGFNGSLLSYDWDYGLKFYAGVGGMVNAVKE